MNNLFILIPTDILAFIMGLLGFAAVAAILYLMNKMVSRDSAPDKMNWKDRIDDIAVVDNFGDPNFSLGEDLDGLYTTSESGFLRIKMRDVAMQLLTSGNDLFEIVEKGGKGIVDPLLLIDIYPIYSGYGEFVNENQEQYKERARAMIMSKRASKHKKAANKFPQLYEKDYLQER